MDDHTREVDSAMRTLILAERIDERTMALEEGVDRIGDDVEINKGRIQSLESTRDTYFSNQETGLRRIIREEFRTANLLSESEIEELASEAARKYAEQRGDNRFNKWIALLGLVLSAAAIAITVLL